MSFESEFESTSLLDMSTLFRTIREKFRKMELRKKKRKKKKRKKTPEYPPPTTPGDLPTIPLLPTTFW